MRPRFARTAFAAAFLAVAVGFHPGCGPAKLQLGLKEDEARVARVATYVGDAESAAVPALAVDGVQILRARALNAIGEPTRNESVTFASNDEDVLKVLSTWTSWPWHYAAVKGLKQGTAQVVCTSSPGGRAAAVTVTVSGAARIASYVRFRSPDVSDFAVNDQRLFSAEFLKYQNDTIEVVANRALEFKSLLESVATVERVDDSSARVKAVAAGTFDLIVFDKAGEAMAGLTLKVKP